MTYNVLSGTLSNQPTNRSNFQEPSVSLEASSLTTRLRECGRLTDSQTTRYQNCIEQRMND